jgi:hypothetical protein
MVQHARSIQNADGQSLYDIRDQLQEAVRSAMKSGDAGQVREAVQSTLEANGFDPSAVREAFRGSQKPGRGRIQAFLANRNPFELAADWSRQV